MEDIRNAGSLTPREWPFIRPFIGVSENGGTPKSSSLIGFSIINHPFWGTPIFGNALIGVWSAGFFRKGSGVVSKSTSPWRKLHETPMNGLEQDARLN